jgi:p-aminobenzoyl-glutamate transporter AbgT
MLIRLIGRFIIRQITGPRASRRKSQNQKEKREDKKP